MKNQEEIKMNNIERFELLGEEFAEIEQKINAKKALNENNILKYGNLILEKTINKIQEEIYAIDEVFPFATIGKFIKYKGMSSEIGYGYGRILIELKFDTKKIIWKHQSDNGYMTFYPKVARLEEREVNLISPEAYMEIFGTENPEIILNKVFQNLINRILGLLEERLKNLKETNEKMPILDFPFIEKIEKKQEQRIKIGEFEDYEVILEKKGE